MVGVPRAELSDALAFQLRAVGLGHFEREYRFAPPRRFRADLAFLEERVLIECDGGIWTGGRHTQPAGFRRDMDKTNTATLKGWRVLRFAADHIASGEAVRTIEAALTAPF